jgi:heterodisulfide reductase subunit A
VLRKVLSVDVDFVVLSAAVVPPADNRELSLMFKVPLGPDGFFQEAHVKLRPVEFGTDGVFVCGMAHYPKRISETMRQACAAAARVLALLSRRKVTVSGSVCEVDLKRCIGCGACVSSCAYGALQMEETKKGKKARVNAVLCKGDGLCNAVCPTGAVSLKHFTNQEIICQVETAFEEALPVRVGV